MGVSSAFVHNMTIVLTILMHIHMLYMYTYIYYLYKIERAFVHAYTYHTIFTSLSFSSSRRKLYPISVAWVQCSSEREKKKSMKKEQKFEVSHFDSMNERFFNDMFTIVIFVTWECLINYSNLKILFDTRKKKKFVYISDKT